MHLVGDLFERGEDAAVTLCEAVLVVLQPPLFSEGDNEPVAQLAQVVARYAREEMVRDLHVQTAVDEVEPGRAVDVHRGSDLARRKALAQTKIVARLCKVREDNLDMQR